MFGPGSSVDRNPPRANGGVKLETVNGGIDLTIPAALNADVSASTVNGDISTDFPATGQVRTVDREGPRRKSA